MGEIAAVPIPIEMAPGAMTMVELWRWAERQCVAIADDGHDPNHYHPLVQGLMLVKQPRHVERDREAQVCFLVGVPADV